MAFASAGKSKAARIAIIAITTSNSIRVKAGLRGRLADRAKRGFTIKHIAALKTLGK